MGIFHRTSDPAADTPAPSVYRPQLPHIPTGSYGKLSVVIATYGQWDYTRECLRTLQADVPDAQVIVVDNASPDQTPQHLREWAPLTPIFRTENGGVSVAWNQGLARAHGDVVGVLNNDTLIHPGGMRRLAQAAYAHGIACHHGGCLNPDLSFRGYTVNPWASDYADGCALFFRDDVWMQVGKFDEGFFCYAEDSDWSLRARQLGYRWEILPDVLTHLGQKTSAATGAVSKYQARSDERLRFKWGNQGVAERILVQRHGALGDVIMLTPALAALRKAKPGAYIHLQCAEVLAPFFAGLPSVNSVGAELPTFAGLTWEPTVTHDLNDAYEASERRGRFVLVAQMFARRLGVGLQDEGYAVPDTSDLIPWAREVLACA